MTNTPTASTHTPINLAPGLDLMVLAGYADDPPTLELVEKCKELLDRAAHIKEIESELTWLVAGEDFDGLETVLESAGWISNRTESTCERLANGIRALLPTLDTADIIDVDATAAFHGGALRARTDGDEFDKLSALAEAIRTANKEAH